MGALLPSLQVGYFQRSIGDYLKTTFGLAEREVAENLDEFLGSDETGIFRGPYVRTRMPFKAAERDATEVLEWYGAPYPPHGHQLAAFERLSSARGAGPSTGFDPSTSSGSGPLPTLVTSGTGSGKTEAFLFPIVDHVLRMQRAGQSGMKALILYPMNALANDQARRLAQLITTHPELAGVTAGLFVGEQGSRRSKVSTDGLITDRDTMRAKAPDILLTNYKMLDQLLLRHDDQGIWQQSATSLQYLVLDEFHTYDGAQGTDVAMLLRRLGLALKRHWPANPAARASFGIDAAAEAAPLGKVTPVATSATLGGDDPSVMIEFANTVFGGGFDRDSVVSETRLSVAEWVAAGAGRPASQPRLLGVDGVDAPAIDVEGVGGVLRQAQGPDSDGSGDLRVARAVLSELYADAAEFDGVDAAGLHDALRAHPLVVEILERTSSPIALKDLVAQLLSGARSTDFEAATTTVNAIIAAISQVRAAVGFRAPSVDVNMWIREMTRLDRVAGPTVAFRWSDDGETRLGENQDAHSDVGRDAMPAIFCRHCGRSGWGVAVKGTGEHRDLEPTSINPREQSVRKTGSFRALIYADREADEHYERNEPVPGFGWWSVRDRSILPTHPGLDAANVDTNILPVRWLDGEDAEKDTNNEVCPACGQRGGIRFMGAAVATLLSVVTTSLFGDGKLDEAEKKELVFTDSVQDAAHRAGFVQSRAHVFGLRNALRRALGDQTRTLTELTTELLSQATTQADRYRLLGTDIVERESFRKFWETPEANRVDVQTRRRVATRMAFDVALEFGLQSSYARTLERTGSVTAEVDAGSPELLERLAREAVTGFQFDAELGASPEIAGDVLVAWARGALEELRSRGGIMHPWLKAYVKDSGLRYRVWGGRPHKDGMPAFPRGRSAPAFARVGPNPKGKVEYLLDDLTSPQGWYARWTSRLLGVSKEAGGRLARRLFESLAEGDVVETHAVEKGGSSHAFALAPERILVSPAADADLDAGNTMLECDNCGALTAGSPTTVAQLAGRPCPVLQCEGGTLQRHVVAHDNFYRSLYAEANMRRVVAREHTSLLPDKVRLEYEQAFKAGAERPDAPNVLVATPTLEMGIDIGDLSTVVLASLPRTVANYVQRVGRAGRLSGSALALAFVPGRHDQLAWYQEPLDLINGEVVAPATYLDAVEILKRQFLAAIFDEIAARGGQQGTRLAKDVLASADPDTPLGQVIAQIEEFGGELLERFLGCFEAVTDDGARRSLLREQSIRELRDWLKPGDDGVVPVVADLAAAARAFSTEVERLDYRIKAMPAMIAELEERANAPAATDDDAAELRAARSVYKMLLKAAEKLEEEFWVAALERSGVLPNYTLLDDAVDLDVAVSWLDAETQQFTQESFRYTRDAQNAIRDFAPGATFYAQGLEIEVDSVETGANGEAIHTWACCPRCGYVLDLTLTEGSGLGPCPRCGEAAFADTGQQLQTIELEKVSAQVRRDEHLISDSSDERVQSHFTMLQLADIDDAAVREQWFDEKTGFGVKYAGAVTLRTLNLGPQRDSSGGVERLLGGTTTSAPLFRVCRECGHRDTDPGENSWREHQPWCSHRKRRDEDPVSVALTRTLETQGMLLRLPDAVDSDEFVLPSLSAALRLGLREVIGGDPNHLDIAQVQDVSHAGAGTATFTGLLVHDRVPGGTGYLADHATAEGLERILVAALGVVENCQCQYEQRSACHRCLLPFAPRHATKNVWRETAVRVLRQLLGMERDETDAPARHHWDVRAEDPGKRESGSALEQRFRKALLEGLSVMSATVSQQPGTFGNTLTVTMPQRVRITVQPEVNLGGSRPDFLFESENAADGKLAVFLDGYRFHATQANNRVADDAEKRAALRRDPSVAVISLTWDDVEEFLDGVAVPVPDWARTSRLYGALGPQLDLNAGDIERIFQNPMSRILDWMRDGQLARAAWTRILPALPLLVVGTGASAELGSLGVAEAGLKLLDGPLPAGRTPAASQRRDGSFAAVVRLQKGATRAAFDSALVLDDSVEALAQPGFRAQWREYLHWSNVLGYDAHRTVVTTRSLLAGAEVAPEPVAPVAPDAVPGGAPDFEFAGEWEIALVDALPDEKELLAPLMVDVVPAPVLAEELESGVLVLATWPDANLAFAPDLDEEELALVREAGFEVRDADGVIEYFRERGEA